MNGVSEGAVTGQGIAIADPAQAKANSQENSHVKTNSDLSANPDGEVVVADRNGPAKEGKGSAGDACSWGSAANNGKCWLKTSFKFKGHRAEHSKKGTEEGEEKTNLPKPEKNGGVWKELKEEMPAAEVIEGETADVAVLRQHRMPPPLL